jgi:peptidoglycan hydrolase-like protein with peptidoglycan-binding domain
MSINGEPVLRQGNTGSAVSGLQQCLKGLASYYSLPTLDPGAVDGNFGPATKNAVVNYQNLISLTADGIVGPVTWSNLDDGDYSEPVLQQGSSGNPARRLQRALIAAGSDPGGIDGQFGGKTKTAVQDFQHNESLAVDGIVGPHTWALVDRVRS